LGRQDQVSYSTFYDPSGRSAGTGSTAFLVDRAAARAQQPNRSFSVERKLPLEFYGKAAFVGKAGPLRFTFAPDAMGVERRFRRTALYRLRNWRNDRYSAVELTIGATSAADSSGWAGTHIERALDAGGGL